MGKEGAGGRFPLKDKARLLGGSNREKLLGKDLCLDFLPDLGLGPPLFHFPLFLQNKVLKVRF